MKKSLIVVATILGLAACNKMPENQFKLQGTIVEVKDSTEVYLKKIDENNRPVVIDTTMILQNSFSFSGETPALDMYLVTINGVGQVPVILEDGVIEINTFKDSVQFAKVEGTEQNQIFTNFRLGNVKIGKRMQAINQEFMEATRSQDSVNMQALRDEYAELQEENKNYMVNFVKDNPKGLVSGMVLNNLLQTRALKASEVGEIYATLAPTVKDHGSVKKIMETINAMKVTEEGANAPDFSGPNPDGKTISLKEVMGKVTIIDFWAAWCKPCRAENPNVVRIYEKYHSKGLNIIGVSLDRSKEDWLKAIEDDKLTWNHISNLAYFNDEIAKKYNVNAIPATFILNAEGKIIARNLRGQQLEDKIAELLP